MFRNLFFSVRLVSMEFMFSIVMLLMFVGMEGRVREFWGVVRWEEFWERLWRRFGFRVFESKFE